MSEQTRPLSGTASAVAAALTAATLLSQEVLIGRVLSVVTWYSLGYLALSLGLLGMTGGALAVHVRPALFEGRRARSSLLWVLSLCSAFTLLAQVWVTHAQIDIDPARLNHLVASLLQLSIVFALPFAAGGAALSALLTRADRPGLVYGADLAGSAAGALAAAPLLTWLGGPHALAFTALLPALATVPLSQTRRTRVASGALLVGIAAVLALPAPAWRLHWIKGFAASTVAPVAERWNSMSFVRAGSLGVRAPFYWGALDDAPMTPVRQSYEVIDGEAGTPCYAFENLDRDLGFLRYDLTSAAHWLRPSGPALVIGVGGGRDVAAAVLYGHRPVNAVEINPLLVDFLTGPLAPISPIAQLPDVTLNVEDGRSWLARHDSKFAVIVASLVDTWASTGMGAMTLTENSLYTREAWDLFLRRLEANGILSFSRWYQPEHPLETARLLSLASRALRDQGISDPEKHLILVGKGRIATILVSPSAFASAQVEQLKRRQITGGFRILLAPGEPSPAWVAPVLAAQSDAEIAAVSRRTRLELSVPSDDRPFFFLQVPVSDWISPGRIRELLEEGGPLGGNLFALGTIAAAFITASVLCAIWLAYPLWRRRGALAGLARTERAVVLAWFAALGLGFMLFEISTAERLHLILGNPTWALALTLAPLTLAAGLGAALSERLDPTRAGQLTTLTLAASGLIALWAALPSSALLWLLSRPFGARAVASVAIVAALGFGLGFLFPLGLRRVQAIAPGGAVWCWGVNGLLSVVGSGAAVFLSVTLGIRATLIASALTYAGTALLAHPLARLAGRPQPFEAMTTSGRADSPSQ